MSYRHTLEAALESLHEIEGLIIRFPRNNDITSIEIDLALQKTRNLYDLLLMVKKSQVEPAASAKEEPVTIAIVKEEPVTIMPVKEEAAVAVEAAETSALKDIREVAPQPVKSLRGTKDMKTVADQFAGRPTLHESLHKTISREEDSVGHIRPVSNLMDAVGINDRFTFIRELFNGDQAAFESALAALNQASSFNDAYNFMIQQFNWDMDSEAVQLLLDIIRRKFIKGRHE